MEYYIASEQGPLGPYTIEQLKERPLRPTDLVWCNGMPEWKAALDIEDLAGVWSDAPARPVFDREKFDRANAITDVPRVAEVRPATADDFDDDEPCPPTYRWLAILAFLGLIPCAIIAIIKSVMVKNLWNEGKHDAARKQSRQVLIWSLVSILVGIPLTIYMFFVSDEGTQMLETYERIFESLM